MRQGHVCNRCMSMTGKYICDRCVFDRRCMCADEYMLRMCAGEADSVCSRRECATGKCTAGVCDRFMCVRCVCNRYVYDYVVSVRQMCVLTEEDVYVRQMSMLRMCAGEEEVCAADVAVQQVSVRQVCATDFCTIGVCAADVCACMKGVCRYNSVCAADMSTTAW